jgi:hypothetical protein
MNPRRSGSPNRYQGTHIRVCTDDNPDENVKAVGTMTTEREVWLADHPSSAPTTCTCGQELDLCHREHCPRCGVRVVAWVASAA